MTIEEYLRSEIEYSKGMMFEADDIEGKSYFEGKADALDELLRKLPEMEHDVTLREVSEFCSKQEEEADVDENPCEHCPMSIEVQYFADSEPSIECGQIADILPRDWNVDYIQKVIREARK